MWPHIYFKIYLNYYLLVSSVLYLRRYVILYCLVCIFEIDAYQGMYVCMYVCMYVWPHCVDGVLPGMYYVDVWTSVLIFIFLFILY